MKQTEDNIYANICNIMTEGKYLSTNNGIFININVAFMNKSCHHPMNGILWDIN